MLLSCILSPNHHIPDFYRVLFYCLFVFGCYEPISGFIKVTEAEKKKEINHDIKTEPLTLA